MKTPASEDSASAPLGEEPFASASRPRLTIVIPVFNEARLIESAVVDFVAALESGIESARRESDAADELNPAGDSLCAAPATSARGESGPGFELILAENGSSDGTAALVDELAARLAPVRAIHCDEANYGRALREGIEAARGEFVLCDEIDLCDLDFHLRALRILEADEADLVVGSKAMASARDERPLLRRMGTRVINGLLRLTLGFQGTDTHGLKAFRRRALLEVVDACVVDRDLFASELVLRAARMGRRVVEIPVEVREKRRPTINLIRRVPNVLLNLGRLIVAIRLGRR